MERLDKKYILNLVKGLPVGSQCEFLQLLNGLREVVEISVITELKDKTFKVINKLKNLGYSVAQKENDIGIVEICISQKLGLAEEAINLSPQKYVDARRFGELMGFPDTAIEAYCEGQDKLLSQDEEKEILGFDNILFPFRLSKKHYKEEIEYIKKCYRLLLDQAPYLISEIFMEEETANGYRRIIKKFIQNK